MVELILIWVGYILALLLTLGCVYFIAYKLLEFLKEFLEVVESELEEGKGNEYEERQEEKSERNSR